MKTAVEEHYNDVGLSMIGDHRIVGGHAVLAPATAYAQEAAIPRHGICPLHLALLTEVVTGLKANSAGVALAVNIPLNCGKSKQLTTSMARSMQQLII
ncbi:unnamed protein product [Sphagnum balticum]